MKCLSKVMIILLVFLFFDFNSGWHTVHGQNDHPKLSTNSVAREEDNEEIVEHHATNIRHDSRNISLSITYGKLFVAKIQHCSGNVRRHYVNAGNQLSSQEINVLAPQPRYISTKLIS